MKNSKRLKSIFTCAAAALILTLGAKETYFYLTDGFSISNITSDHIDGKEWETRSLSKLEREEVCKALDQVYTYLGKGHQAYAFESADKRYVIKLLKFQPYRYYPIVTHMPLPKSLDAMRQEKLVHKAEKRDALFRSWQVAFENLKEETGVLYIHINRHKDFQKKVKLYNKTGMLYELNLDDYVFMVQRKAEPIEDVIAKSLAEDNIAKAKRLIDQMIDLYISEYNRGLAEKDRYIVRNTGVYADKPMHIDTGRLCFVEQLKDSKTHYEELMWKTSVMAEWLDRQYPELALHLKERLHSLKAQG